MSQRPAVAVMRAGCCGKGKHVPTDRVVEWTERVNELERIDLASKRRIASAMAAETPRILALDLMSVLGDRMTSKFTMAPKHLRRRKSQA